jgi:hypothetical protein
MQPCDTSKYNCGIIVPSSCVPYTGSDLTVLVDPTTLSCNANINDVITILDATIKGILEDNDLTTLNPLCLSSLINPATITPAQLHQIEITQICSLQAQVTTVTNLVNNLNIGNELITINLLCLAPAAAPCQVQPNTYTLLAVLNTMLNEICALKTAVGI